MMLEQQLDFMKSRKPLLFVVEGPDASGKTSLARFIANKLNAAYMHSTWTPGLQPGMLDYFISTVNNAGVCINTAGLDVVLDRHWPSEVCYRNVLRPHISAMPIKELRQMLRDLRVIYIFCKGDENRHAKHINPGHPYNVDQYRALQAEYLGIFSVLSETEVVYPYSIEECGDRLDSFIQHIINEHARLS